MNKRRVPVRSINFLFVHGRSRSIRGDAERKRERTSLALNGLVVPREGNPERILTLRIPREIR